MQHYLRYTQNMSPLLLTTLRRGVGWIDLVVRLSLLECEAHIQTTSCVSVKALDGLALTSVLHLHMTSC